MNSDKEKPRNLFEILLRDLALTFDPSNLSLTLKFPSLILQQNTEGKQLINKNKQQNTMSRTSLDSNKPNDPEINKKKERSNLKQSQELEDDMEFVNLDLSDLDTGSNPPRAKIHLKAYIKLALHALKYANPKKPQNKWVEVIGLLTGHIEKKDTPLACLVIQDAFPIGHGTEINAQIQDPQSMVRVYNEIRDSNKKQFIVGWYHSHPSYGMFMSKTDYYTQVRYQKLGTKDSQLTAPIALVIDPTKISTRSYGFEIFRLRNDLRTWEKPPFQVLNCPLESLPEMIQTLLPLAEENGRMFFEYDH